MGFIITIVAIYLLLFRLCWDIAKTILIFIYDSIVNILIAIGIPVNTARAFISLSVIVLVLWWYFNI